MSTNTSPTCPSGCTGPLPVNDFDFCKSEVHTGEIELLYVAAPDAECFTDLTAIGEWNARLSETSLDPDAIRRFRVVGSMPASSQEAIDISLGQKYYSEKEFTLNIELEDITASNYEFFRTVGECNQEVKIWWQTAGGDLWGGNCGVDASVSSNIQVEVGQQSIHKLIITVTWKYKYSPDRTTSPLA